MPSTSKAQQRLMGQAYAVKIGELDPKDIDIEYRDMIVKLSKNMEEKDLKSFAKTKHKNLPERIPESLSDFMNENNPTATTDSVNGMGDVKLPQGDIAGSGDIPHQLTGATAEDDTVEESYKEAVNEDSNFDYHINVIKKAEDYLALNGMESVGEIEKLVSNYLSDREIRPDDKKLITSLEFFKNRLGEKPNPKTSQLGKYLVKNKLAESVVTEDNDTIDNLNQMALTDLERICDYASMIKDRMSQGQELDAWMYSKISDSVKNLNSVHDTMDGTDGTTE